MYAGPSENARRDRALKPKDVVRFLALLVCVVFALTSYHVALSAPLFASQFLSFGTGTWPMSVAMGDLNGDGRRDLAVANRYSNTVSVLLSDGNGTFAAKQDLATGASPWCVAVGDFNADGKQDLAVANAGSNSLSVFLGNGDATFGPRTDFASGSSPRFVVVGDLNGDGKMDLAVANYNANAVSVLLGNGNGTFAAKTDLSVGSSPYAVAIADLNGDGRLDLVAVNYGSSTISVLLGNGNGTFGAKTDFATGASPRALTIADVNQDGRPDVAVANEGSLSVSVLLGNGNGTLAAKTDFAVGSNPYAVAIADFTGDAKPDLAVANYGSNTLSVLLGNGTGGFGPKTDYDTGSNPSSVALGDLSGDGKQDLTVANFGSGSVSVLLSDGDGTFGTKAEFATGSKPWSVTIGDFNADAKPDVAVVDYGSSTVSVLLGSGSGTFGIKTDYPTGLDPWSVAVGDFNGDARPDLAVANLSSGSASVLLGSGNGTFGTKSDFATGPGPASVAVGDLDRDGRLDLAVADWSATTVSVLLGNGNGTFRTKVDYAVGSNPRSVAVGDFNRDGALDLAVANEGGAGTVSVLIGNGDGTFRPKADYSTGSSPRSVAVGDLNGDGNLDLAVANQGSNTVSVLLGSGNGAFGAKADFATGASPVAVAVGELDGDGRPDLVVANHDDRTVSVFLGVGGGAFGTRTDYACGKDPWSVAVGDLDVDGRPELVVANSSSNTLSILMNVGQPYGGGTPNPPTSLTSNLTCPTVVLSWNDNAQNETRYEIEMDVNGSGSWLPAASLPANATTWTSGPLAAGDAYTYRVRACSWSTCSAWSNTSTVTVAPPQPPTALTVTNLGTGSSLKIAWNSVVGATGYNVTRSDGAGQSLTGTEWTDTGVIRGTTYTYTVAAVNACGVGTSSGPVSRAPDYYPVLLVHGIFSNHGVFTDCSDTDGFPCDGVNAQKLGDRLHVLGLHRLFYADYSKSGSIPEAAVAVEARITEVLQQCPGDDKVVIVAHSQGGLISRYLIQRKGEDARVARLIMLGTPNHGSDLALMKYLLDAGSGTLPPFERRIVNEVFAELGIAQVEDLIPGSPFLTELNYGPSSTNPDLPDLCGPRRAEQVASTVQYWLIHGTSGWCTRGSLNRVLSGPSNFLCVPNDGVVETGQGTDGDLVALAATYKRTDAGLDTHNPQQLAAHFALAASDCFASLTTHAAIASFVYQIITDAVAAPEAAAELSRLEHEPRSIAQSQDELPLREIARHAGTLTGLLAEQDTLEIDNVRQAWFVQSGTAEGLEFSLRAPDGATITPADTIPGKVSYVADPGLAVQAFVLSAPAAGRWVAVTSGPAQDYLVQSMAETDTTLSVSVAATPDGRVMQIVSSIQGSGAPLPGGILSAVLREPSGLSTPITFFDDGLHGDGAPGDGVWGASIPSVGAGAYECTVNGLLYSGSTKVLGRYAVASAVLQDVADLTLQASPVRISRVGQSTDSLNVTIEVLNEGGASARGVILGMAESTWPPAISGTFDVPAHGSVPVSMLWMPHSQAATTLTLYVDRLTPVVQSRYDNDSVSVAVTPSLVSVAQAASPSAIALSAWRPNPTHATATIAFSMPVSGRVTLELFDVAGRRIRTLFDGWAAPGIYPMKWDGLNQAGSEARPGVYYCRLRIGSLGISRSVVVIK